MVCKTAPCLFSFLKIASIALGSSLHDPTTTDFRILTNALCFFLSTTPTLLLHARFCSQDKLTAMEKNLPSESEAAVMVRFLIAGRFCGSNLSHPALSSCAFYCSVRITLLCRRDKVLVCLSLLVQPRVYQKYAL